MSAAPQPIPGTADPEHCFAQLVRLFETAPQGRRLLDDHRGDLQVFHRRLERWRSARARPLPAVAFAGQSNVGKSTLLNALAGAPIAPVLNGPCTPCPVIYRKGETLRIEARRGGNSGSSRVERIAVPDHDGLKKFLGRPDLDYDEITVWAPCELLRDIEIIDTPGFGAAEMEATARHIDRLTDFLERRSCPVFWCIKSTQPPEPEAMRFYHDHLLGLCEDIVLTHADKLGEDSRARYAHRYAPYFPEWRMPPLHFVSSTDAASVSAFGAALREKLARESCPDRVFDELCALGEHLMRGLRATESNARPILAPFGEIVWNNEFVHSPDQRMRRLARVLVPELFP